MSQLFYNAQVLWTQNQQIERLLMERDRIKGRIDDIGHYITIKYLACEDMSRTTFFASIMIYVHQFMKDLKDLQRGLAPKPVARPNDAPRAPKIRTLRHSQFEVCMFLAFKVCCPLEFVFPFLHKVCSLYQVYQFPFKNVLPYNITFC